MTTQHTPRRSRSALAVTCGAALATVAVAPSAAGAGSPVLESSHFRIGFAGRELTPAQWHEHLPGREFRHQCTSAIG